MKQNLTTSVIIVLLVIIFGALYFSRNPRPEVEVREPVTPEQVTLRGKFECLPYKNPELPHTMVCAPGIQVNNEHYALDLGLIDHPNIDTGMMITIEGILVPIEMISSDAWQIYDIEGVIQVNTLT